MTASRFHPFDPRVVFTSLWAAELLGHVFTSVFRPLSIETWFLVFLAVGSFLVGAEVVQRRYGERLAHTPVPDEGDFERWVRRAAPWLLAGTCVAAVFALRQILATLELELSLDDIAAALAAARLAIINDFTEGAGATQYLKILFAGVGLALYLLCFARSMSRWMRAVVLLVGLLAAVFTTGRLTLLLFFVGAAFIVHALGFIRVRGLALLGGAFVVVFVGLALVLGKGEEDTDDALSQVTWNLQVYTLGSVAAFDRSVQWDDPQIPGGALLPNPLRSAVNKVSPFTPIAEKPSLNPAVEMPVWINTFSALFPVYHDLGAPGVLVVFLLLGAMHQALFRRQQAGGSWWRYVYALSLYPLVMTVFEEAYFSSPGFWLALLAPPLIVRAIYLARRWVPTFKF